MALEGLLALALSVAKAGYNKAASYHSKKRRKYTDSKIQEHKEKALQELESRILHFVGNTQHKSTQEYLDELDHYINQKDDFIKEKEKEIQELTSKANKAEKIARYAFRACTLVALLLATLAYIKH